MDEREEEENKMLEMKELASQLKIDMLGVVNGTPSGGVSKKKKKKKKKLSKRRTSDVERIVEEENEDDHDDLYLRTQIDKIKEGDMSDQKY